MRSADNLGDSRAVREGSPPAERLDRVVTDLLVPLRAGDVDQRAFEELMALIRDLAREFAAHQDIPIELAGTLWSVFCQMIAAADHALEPDRVLDVAWSYQEELKGLFRI